MSLIYKTFCEIRLHHEYFLTKVDGTSIFEKNTQQLRDEFLKSEFKADHDSVSDIIQFSFPKHLEERYAGLGLKIVPTYTGCQIAGRVLEKRLSDNSLVYEPLFSIDKESALFISILDKTFSLDRISNGRVRRSVPSVYLFSNVTITGARTFPFLTNPIPSQDMSQVYEQGELSLAGSLIQEFYKQGGVDKYENVAGIGFANESDRILVPTTFNYKFINIQNVTEASFTLTDFNGELISTESKSSAEGIKEKVTLDFTGKVKEINTVENASLAERVYELKVETNNGTTTTHTLIFSNDLSVEKPWGVVAIKLTPSSDPFSIYNSDGYLIRRKDGTGAVVSAPIFEIPVKSRLTYWRFRHDKARELLVSSTLNDYLMKEGDVLVTKKPRSLSRSWFFLRKDGSPDAEYVPSPVSLDLKIEPDRRLFFEVVVPQSDLFPIVP